LRAATVAVACALLAAAWPLRQADAGYLTPVPADTPNVVTDAPLGERANPIRTVLPEGELDYLSRLRCSDGAAPRYERTGSRPEPGPYGKILDAYRVQCAGEKPRTLFLDMYHCAQDARTPPGFTLVPREGQPLTRAECVASPEAGA
jgi:hypothetical protein